MTESALAAEATDALRQLVGDPTAEFRDGQLDAITALVADRRRALVVQRTGWGKSAVYFVATALLRARGAGPTLLVSPLLGLMRNQIAAAERGGLRAATINSDNQQVWDEVIDELEANTVDVLLVSPERFANQAFRDRVLPKVAPRTGLLVIDEVHCISDWGHDFRPDYRRLARVLDLLPRGVPVLGTTATANDRVVADVQAQLGEELLTIRGPLDRETLALDAIELRSQPDRLAWLAQVLPTPSGHRDRLHADRRGRAAGRRVAARHRASRPAPTPARPTPTRSSRSKPISSPTRSRPSSRPRRSAWATTSPTSPSSCTTSRPAPPSPTTSRSDGPAAASTGPRASCSAATRTPTSRTGSSAPPSPTASRPRPSSRSSPTGPTGCRCTRSRTRSTSGAAGSRAC